MVPSAPPAIEVRDADTAALVASAGRKLPALARWKLDVTAADCFSGWMDSKGWHSRGYLPHLDAPGELQGLTFRLGDSVPKKVIERWQRELSGQPENLLRMELAKRIARDEDAGYGECLLRDREHAQAIQNCLLHADGRRYRLIEWCIMPNHVHVLIETLEGVRLGDIVRAWKTYGAKVINQRLGRRGSIWEEDYYDRYIRDNNHLLDSRLYIQRNPVKAGLCSKPEDWEWGSAAMR